jgi:ABC-type molybdenum transport system ATPase subunit/photorepair protein PhrA
MTTGIAETAAAIELINTARKQGWLDALLTAVRKKHKIILLGSTGTGKTNFLSSLTESVPKAVDIMNRTEIAKKHRLKIQKYPFVFVDTPGQALHESRRLKAIREALASGISGVVNVVSYGYHEYRIGAKNAVDKKGKVSEQFLFQKYFGTAPMSGEFGDDDRIRAKAHLIQELLAAIGKVENG